MLVKLVNKVIIK